MTDWNPRAKELFFRADQIIAQAHWSAHRAIATGLRNCDVRLMAVEDGTGVMVGYAGTRAGIIASEEHARLEVRDKEGAVVFAAPNSQPTTVEEEEE